MINFSTSHVSAHGTNFFYRFLDVVANVTHFLVKHFLAAVTETNHIEVTVFGQTFQE
jgi:hypothetical protein